MKNLVLITPPAIEPLSLLEAKEHLRLDDGLASDDDYISALITAAREYCEAFQNRAYITQTWQVSFNYWPERVIQIPRGSLQKVDSITYKDSYGAITTLRENEDYVVSTVGILGRVSPVFGIPWPLDAVVIEFTCGYGDNATDVPAKVKNAMKLLISHWYENRTPLSESGQAPGELMFAVSALLYMDRIVPA